MYSADALRRDLENIPTQEDIPQLVSAVKDVCEEHGVKMAVSTSTKEKGGGRLVSTTLLCVHGMPLRKKPASSGEYKCVMITLCPPPPPCLPRVKVDLRNTHV